MELIDREELLRIIDRKIKYTKGDIAMDSPYNVRLNSLLAFKHIIMNCARIDAEPIKHASWIYCDLDGTGICSSCRSYGNSQDSYCSNCGAKMDLEAEQVETHQVV